MNDNQLDRRVERAFGKITPDVFDSVLSDCRRQKGRIIMAESRRSRGGFARSLAGIAAALVLVLGAAGGIMSYGAAHSPVAVVSLDVNPSIELKVNRNEKVLEVTARNEDAQTVLGDMDLKGSSLDVAVNAIIGSMLREGYLSDMANSILVSVSGESQEAAAAIQQRLSRKVSAMLEGGSFAGSVLSQVVPEDDALKALAEKHGISVGKARLIKEITALKPEYSFEALVPLSINDLNLIGGSLPDISMEGGSASDKNYIGQDSALTKALEHAGVPSNVIQGVKAELDLENGIMVYEIEFSSGKYEYEYEINASSGEIIQSGREMVEEIEALAEQHAEEWKAWAEAHAEEWETWAREYAGDWEAWARDHGDEVEKWAEKYADDWERWAEAWGAWADSYFDF